MNETINLCEILKGCEGIELYHKIYGNVKLKKILSSDSGSFYPIILESTDKCGYKNETCVTINGLYDITYNGECMLVPSKNQQDWSKFELPIPVDTPIMCSNDSKSWYLGYYKCFENGEHYVVVNGLKTRDNPTLISYNKIIPFDKFNPNNINESLKYNIQK